MNVTIAPSAQFMKKIVLLALIVLCTYWMFFDTYRINAFNIVSHDDYAPYLLAIVGDDGGRVPGSPFVYRFLSVVVAVPFYHVLPVYEFTLLENVDRSYLRAIESLAMVAYLAMLGCSILTFLMTTKRLGGSPSAGAIGALLMLLVLQFSGYKGVDPIGILIVFTLLYFSRSFIVFGVLIALSIGFNEKISLVLSMLMISRVLYERDSRFLIPALMSALGFCGYLLLRLTLDVPGNEHQLQVGGFAASVWRNFLDIFTLKRFVLVVLPLTMLTATYFLGLAAYRRNSSVLQTYFSRADVAALYGLFFVTLAMGMQFGIGRVLMFCAPFYLPMAAIQIESMLLDLNKR